MKRVPAQEDELQKPLVQNESTERAGTDYSAIGDRHTDINEAIENGSCGLGTIFLLGGAFMFSGFEGAEIITLSVVGLMVKCEWELSPFWIGALQMNSLVSMGVACLLFSGAGDKFGRRRTMIFATIGIIIFGVWCGFSTRFWHLFVLRGLLGAMLGVGLGPAVAYLAEIPPAKWRPMAISVISVGWGVGASISCLVAYFTITPYGWRGYLIAISLAMSPTLLFLCLARESPRYDMIRGNVESAERTIDLLYKLNRVPKRSFRLKAVAGVSGADSGDDDVKDISIIQTIRADSSIQKNLALISAYGCLAIMCYYIGVYGAPRFFNEGYCSPTPSTENENCVFKESVLLALFLSSITEPIGVLVGVFLAGLVGRRTLLFLVVAAFVVLESGMYFCVNGVYLFVVITIAKGTGGALVWTMFLVNAEYFPTAVRSFCVAFMGWFSRIGGIIGIYCVQYLFNIDPRLLIGTAQAGAMLMLVILWFLKRDMADQLID